MRQPSRPYRLDHIAQTDSACRISYTAVSNFISGLEERSMGIWLVADYEFLSLPISVLGLLSTRYSNSLVSEPDVLDGYEIWNYNP
jgi:hypothetical protein